MNIETRNLKATQKLLGSIRKDIKTAAQKAADKEDFLNRVGVYLNVNPLTTSKYAPVTNNLVDMIQQPFQILTKGLPVGGTREIYAETARENTMNYVTGMGEDLKDLMRETVAQNLKDGNGMREISQDLQNNIQTMTNTRANSIARTETVRSMNLGRYCVADNDNYKAFVVYSATDCCELCADTYEGQSFSIDDTDMLPPLHVNCRCAAQFYRTEKLAETMADNMNANNEVEAKAWNVLTARFALV